MSRAVPRQLACRARIIQDAGEQRTVLQPAASIGSGHSNAPPDYAGVSLFADDRNRQETVPGLSPVRVLLAEAE